MMYRSFIALGIATSLSACVSLLPPPKPAATIYRLSSSSIAADKYANAEAIRIDRPSANQVFNSNNIIVTKDGKKLSVVAEAHWSEATPILIQSTLIDALAASPSFIGLVPTSGARSETRLHLSVKNFEANFDNGPKSAPLAVVDYRVTYARADDRKLLGTHSVRQTERASSINVSSIVTAMEAANDAAMKDIVTWLESQKSTGGT